MALGVEVAVLVAAVVAVAVAVAVRFCEVLAVVVVVVGVAVGGLIIWLTLLTCGPEDAVVEEVDACWTEVATGVGSFSCAVTAVWASCWAKKPHPIRVAATDAATTKPLPLLPASVFCLARATFFFIDGSTFGCSNLFAIAVPPSWPALCMVCCAGL